MASRDPITDFVKEALSAGKSKPEIAEALRASGWSTREIDLALGAFGDEGFLPPVPRPRPHVTPRDAFIYLLLFTSLGVVAGHLISLIYGILNLTLPDITDNAYVANAATNAIRWAIAALIVAGPIYLWLTVKTRRQIARDESASRSLVRKWLTYLAMFIAAVIFLGDATYVLYKFLEGEATLRFLLKALTMGVVTGAVFLFYLSDVNEGKEHG